VEIRAAGPADAETVLELITELATYERATHEVIATPAMVRRALERPGDPVWAVVAEDDGEVVGLAMWFATFSTWHASAGLYLEDLFVRPAARGRGVGAALMGRLARECVERGYSRFEWSVLDWNEPAHAFYRRLGAAPLEEWTRWRLEGEDLRRLAGA
jgi:GNAT superfamily N-acetyltransferase